MLPIIIVMLVIVALAALVLLYVAYPHRGESTPGAPWVGTAMTRAVSKLKALLPQVHEGTTTSRRNDHDWSVPR